MRNKEALQDQFTYILIEIFQALAAFNTDVDSGGEHMQEHLNQIVEKLYTLTDFNNEHEKDVPELVDLGKKITTQYGIFSQNYNMIMGTNSLAPEQVQIYSQRAGMAFDAGAQLILAYLQAQKDL